MVKSVTGVVLLGLLIASLFIPVDLPYEVNSTGLCYPLRSWSLIKNTDGTLDGKLVNNLNGQIEDFQSYQFERGDVVNVKFANIGTSSGYIEKGDAVASILSDMLSERLVQLQNQLSVERATLTSYRSGEKREIVEVANQRIESAEVALNFAQQQEKRALGLFNEGLISSLELEATQKKIDLARAELEIAKKGHTVVSTGQKVEEVQLVQARINAMEKEISFLQDRNSRYQIISPIGGRLRYGSSENVYELIVDQIDSTMVRVPIRLKDRQFLEIGNIVQVTPSFQDETYDATIVGFDDQVQVIDMEQVILAKAILVGQIPQLPYGMPVECKIHAGDIQPLEYFKRSMRTKSR